MAIKIFSKKLSDAQKAGLEVMNDAKVGRELVKISDKISSSENSKGLLVKIGDEYFRIRELG